MSAVYFGVKDMKMVMLAIIALSALVWILINLILIAVFGEVLISEPNTLILYSEIILTLTLMLGVIMICRRG